MASYNHKGVSTKNNLRDLTRRENLIKENCFLGGTGCVWCINKSHINSFLWCTDGLITQVFGQYEARQSILQPGPHPNALSRTATLINMIPHLRAIKTSSKSVIRPATLRRHSSLFGFANNIKTNPHVDKFTKLL